MKQLLYFDHAATTPPSPQTVKAMLACLTRFPGNPSSPHAAGREGRRRVEKARGQVAKTLGCAREEVYFTSGGTESNNWAIRSAATLRRDRGRHILTTRIEHSSVLEPIRLLEKDGFEVTYLEVDEAGLVSPRQMENALRPDTILISLQTANNEIGTIQPVEAVAALARERDILFHTDGVQAVSHLPLSLREWKPHLFSLSGHKCGGPQGVGALYVQRGSKLPPLTVGGGQEGGLRSGSENVAGIVGLGAALEEGKARLQERREKVARLAAALTDGLLTIPQARLTGHPHRRLPGIVSLLFPGVDGRALVRALDEQGVCAASSSACSSRAGISHVLLATGLSEREAGCGLRLSLSDGNTLQEIETLLQILPRTVAQLRRQSPLWEEKNAEVSL